MSVVSYRALIDQGPYQAGADSLVRLPTRSTASAIDAPDRGEERMACEADEDDLVVATDGAARRIAPIDPIDIVGS